MKLSGKGSSRRSFIAGSLGTGVLMGLGVVLPGCSRESAVEEVVATGGSQLFSPAVWFEMDSAGQVVVNIAKAEMGQHVGTALARIVADELGAAWDSVSLAHVDTDPRWGYMVTGGSWSVVTSFEMLSRAGAAGRTVLIDAAAALRGHQEQVDAHIGEHGVALGLGEHLFHAWILLIQAGQCIAARLLQLGALLIGWVSLHHLGTLVAHFLGGVGGAVHSLIQGLSKIDLG